MRREIPTDATKHQERYQGNGKVGETGWRRPAKLTLRVANQPAPGTKPTWRRFLAESNRAATGAEPRRRRGEGNRETGRSQSGKDAIAVVANQPTGAFRSFRIVNWPKRRTEARKFSFDDDGFDGSELEDAQGGDAAHVRVKTAGDGAEQHASAAAWVRELAETKAQLGQELEANLKQLRAILAEGQRIAGDLEVVLHETRLERPKPESGPSERRRRKGSVGVRHRSEPRGH